MDGCPDPPGNGNFSSPQQLQQLSQQPRDYGDVVDRHSPAYACADLSEVAYETCAFERVRFFTEHTVQHKLGPQPAFWHLPACVCDGLFDEVPSRFPSCVSTRLQPVNARHCSSAIAVDQRRYQQVFHLPSFTSQLSCFFFHIASFMLRVSHMTCIIGLAVQHKLGPQPAFMQTLACVCGSLFDEACAVCFIFHPSFYILHLLCSFFVFHLPHITFLIALAAQHGLGQPAFCGCLFEVACAVCVLFHISFCIFHPSCSFFMFHLSHLTFLISLAAQHGLGQPASCGGLFEVACAVCVLFHISFCILHHSCSFFMIHLSHLILLISLVVQHGLGPQPAFWHSPACICGGLFEVACPVCFILHPSSYILHLLSSSCMFHLSHTTFPIALAAQHGLGPQPAIWHSPACICGGLFEVACAVCVFFHISFCIFHPSCSFFMFHLSLMPLFVRVAVQHTLGLQPAFRHSPACIRGSLLEEVSAVDNFL